MQKFALEVEGPALRLRRKRWVFLPALTGALFFVMLSLWLFFLPQSVLGKSHLALLRNLRVAAVGVFLVSGVYLGIGLRRLRPQIWSFDRDADMILLNGRLVCGSGEVSTVHLDDGFYDTSISATGPLVLYLQTQAGRKLELAREDAFGVGRREMREIAQSVSEQTGADIVLKDGFVVGWRRPDEVEEPVRRWGPKRGRSARRHRPKGRRSAL